VDSDREWVVYRVLAGLVSSPRVVRPGRFDERVCGQSAGLLRDDPVGSLGLVVARERGGGGPSRVGEWVGF
jgi:hypothetical protein